MTWILGYKEFLNIFRTAAFYVEMISVEYTCDHTEAGSCTDPEEIIKGSVLVLPAIYNVCVSASFENRPFLKKGGYLGREEKKQNSFTSAFLCRGPRTQRIVASQCSGK